MMSSKYAEGFNAQVRKSSLPVDKPLPPPPASAEPQILDDGINTVQVSNVDSSFGDVMPMPPVQNSTVREVSSVSAPVLRLRKKVHWKGKNLLIQLPADSDRGSTGGGLKPLTAAEVSARLDAFEKFGYDTKGYDHWYGQDVAPGGIVAAQNRAIYPTSEDIADSRRAEKYVVHIPNKAEWAAYVDFLTEQKLRALGVSIGDEPALDTPMSRQSSAQYPALPFSPPLPTPSGGSHRYGQSMSISTAPYQLGPSPGHSSTRSIASPISAFGNPRHMMHMHRHSTFASPTNFLQSQPATPSFPAWSPQQYFSQQGVARGGSPALHSNGRVDLSSIMSPNSPFGSKSLQQYPFPQQNDQLLVQLQQQQHLQSQLMQQQQSQLSNTRPSSTLQEVPEAEDEDDFPVQPYQAIRDSNTFAVPTPRGHQHNISAGLERDVESADYHLEKAIDKQLDEGGDFNTESRFGVLSPVRDVKARTNGANWQDPKREQPILHQPQPHSRAHSLTQKRQVGEHDSEREEGEITDDVDAKPKSLNIELDPNVADDGDGRSTHSKTNSQISNILSESLSARSSTGPHGATRPSHISKPSMSALNVAAKEFKFNPSASFNASASGVPAITPQSSKVFVPASNNESRTYSTRASLEGLESNLNVTAPTFELNSASSWVMPSADFNFASKGLSFAPNAPEFKPTNTLASVTAPTDSSDSTAAGGSDRVFNLRFSDVVKPAKRSKAVPIIRPDPISPKADRALNEDKEGRFDQAEQKRVRRRSGSDGDDVPQFAVPSHPLTDMSQGQATKKDQSIDQFKISQDKENMAPLEAVKTAERVNVGTDKQVSVLHETKASVPELPAPTRQLHLHDDVEPAFPKKHTSKISLSATAKPFEFKALGNPDIDIGLHVTKPSLDHHSQVEKIQDNSNDARSRHLSRSPATTYRHSDDGSYQTAAESRRHVPYPDDSEGIYFESFVPPTFNEIDQVMKHFDAEGSDFGVEKDEPSWTQSTVGSRSSREINRLDLRPTQHFRSDAPSPSPRRLFPQRRNTEDTSTPITHDPFSDERAGLAYDSPVHRLNVADDLPISDWDDVVSSAEEDKFHHRTAFFDGHMDNIIATALANRLDPLEQSLQVLHDSIATMSQRSNNKASRRSASAIDSDADDEDDDVPVDFGHRNRSPRRDRKFEKMRHIITEALAAHQSPIGQTQPMFDSKEFYQALSDIKDSLIKSDASSEQIVSIKQAVQEALLQQQLTVLDSKENDIVNASTTRISELENALKEAEMRLESEIETRHSIERRGADTQRLLNLTEEELGLLKETAKDDRARIRALEDETHTTRLNNATAEAAQDDLVKRLSAVTAQNEALEATLEEYRISSTKWRKDLDDTADEKARLTQVAGALQLQVEEALRIRTNMRERLEVLQRETICASSQVATERTEAQREIQEHLTKYEVLSARIEAEGRTRERLETELERLEAQEREAMRLKIVLEQSQQVNARLEEANGALRLESSEHQKTAERYEREFREAREAGRIEVARTRRLMEADVENANNQVNIVRADLEREVAKVRAEIDSVRLDADTTKVKHALVLEQEADARRDALGEAEKARTIALKDQHQRYNMHLKDLEQQHNRTLQNAVEDKERVEELLNGRLSLADAKVEHMQDKVLLLEEKLEVAKSAAQAAIEAAKSAKVPASHSSGTLSKDKVSSQALRESIAVLQEQLQERESRIENLEDELSSLDRDAPNKLKDRDTEISWLRELLDVRLDDLSDLISSLSRPTFDREVVRDAAIRIRSNLQMEQQEKERLVGGNQNFPTLASLSNFASPKAVQLAAAFGNWRRGKDQAPSKLSRTGSGDSSRTQTPSKPAPTTAGAQGFLSGLMTPPTSNLRRTPEPGNVAASKNARLTSARLERGLDIPPLSSRQQEKQPAPSTPPLMREASYDQDAEDGDYSTTGFYDDEESTVDGNPSDRRGSFSRFGPGLTTDGI